MIPSLLRVSTQNIPVCTLKTSPCMPAPRELVEHIQHSFLCLQLSHLFSWLPRPSHRPTCSRIIHNPFSENSKAIIREFFYVELFELCETFPKEQCSHCLHYWNQGVIYCTCGHFLVESESSRKSNKLRLDALSIPHYVIKRGATHGVLNTARPRYKENTTWLGMRGRDAARKLTLKVDILHVFTIDFSEIQLIVNHNSQSDGQNKSAKSGMNLRKKTITYKLTPEE